MSRVLYKIIMILCIAILLLNTAANIIYAAVEIQLDKVYLEKIGQADYHLKYYNEKKNANTYVVCSIVGYYTKKGFNPAYCMNKNLDGAEKDPYYVTTENILKNDKVWRAIRNGYPFKSYEEMGLSSEFDAYTVTKMAVYCILGESKLENFKAESDDKEAIAMLDALKKLVDIGLNGKETQETDPLEIEKVGELKTEGEYITQEYKIKSKANYSTYEIMSESKIPENCFIANLNGEKKKEFEYNENFKVMIPKDTINKDLNFDIKILSRCQVYLILEGKTTVENTQNYVVSTGDSMLTSAETKLNVKANQSRIIIKKVEDETNKPIKGVKFAIYDEKNNIIETKETDKDGEIKFENLYPLKYIVKEIATDSKHILNETPINVELNYSETKNLIVSNKQKKGHIKIIKTDSQNSELKIEGTKFELINSENQKIGVYETNNNGEIYIDNLPIGEYKIREIEANKWYNLDDKPISIEVKNNQISHIEIKNELKKGQIKIIKIDKNNENIKLEGVKFQIKDKDGKILENLITDKHGEAISSKYSIKDFESVYIEEIDTNPNYVLNKEIQEIKLVENKITDVVIKNEKIKGKIKVIKTSQNDNKINKKRAGSPIENVKFEILDKDGKKIQTITTDKNGIAITSDLEKGEYKVKEIETNEEYFLNKNIFDAEIKNNNDIVSVNIQNESKNPELDIEKSGPDTINIGEKIEYDISIRNTGNTSLDDFTMTEYIPAEYIKIKKFYTGIYNQDIRYNFYYKTNLSEEYILFLEDLNSKQNYEINFEEELAENEYITEIKIEFNTVDVGFCSNENPHIIGIVRETVKSEDSFINNVDLSGRHNEYKVYDRSKWKTIAYKFLPKTGF